MFDIRVRLGTVYHLSAAERFDPSARPTALRVTGVRLVTNRPESDGWLWLEGFKTLPDGTLGAQVQVLVRASTLLPWAGQP
ncbi:hypothetical protein GCM10027290_52690 [Micromonospora sonneratiae]|uniref:Uncharacterized protein n=1 Tax=Micromonospora sonneratiae TaxID=1184706 RepID=A0ABW3YPN1_9ACTN